MAGAWYQPDGPFKPLRDWLVIGAVLGIFGLVALPYLTTNPLASWALTTALTYAVVAIVLSWLVDLVLVWLSERRTVGDVSEHQL